MSDWYDVRDSIYTRPAIAWAEWDDRFADALIIASGGIPPRKRSRFGAWLYTLLTRRPA